MELKFHNLSQISIMKFYYLLSYWTQNYDADNLCGKRALHNIKKMNSETIRSRKVI